jgi:hypothetical protein
VAVNNTANLLACEVFLSALLETFEEGHQIVIGPVAAWVPIYGVVFSNASPLRSRLACRKRYAIMGLG